jgi:hypothetical protein
MALSLVASAFSAYYYFVRFVVGPMTVDEVYLAHTTWLVREGYDQYIDFYSNHLPTYFYLLNSVLPHSEPTDLTFIWTVRLSNILIVCGYVFLLTWLNRNKAIFLFPFLLLFVTIGRMTEFRPDTYGLFLFNAAWATLLSGYSRGKLVVASLLAASALLFSARGSIMAVGFAATLAYLLYQHRDARSFMTIRRSCCLGGSGSHCL